MWRRNSLTRFEDSDQSISEEDDLYDNLAEDYRSLGSPAEKKVEVKVLSQLEALRDTRGLSQRARHTSLPQKENGDSDQSISEEDDLCNSLEDYTSLAAPVDKKVGVQVLSQLEGLRNARELLKGTENRGLIDKGQTDFCIADDVEFPVFPEDDCFHVQPMEVPDSDSDKEIFLDNYSERTEGFRDVGVSSPRSTRQEKVCPWTAANREASSLAYLLDNAGASTSRPLYAKASRSCKGGTGKAKPKFSSRSYLQEEEEDNIMDKSDMFAKEQKIKDSDIFSIPAQMETGHDHKNSMVEILGMFHVNNHNLPGFSGKYSRPKGGGKQALVKRSMSSLGDRTMDNDHEGLNSSSSNDNDDDNHQDLNLIIAEPKRKTVADQFHEAYGAVSMKNDEHSFFMPGKPSNGLFGKLQLVMQSEKEKVEGFLNRLDTEDIPDEGNCVDVKILSRCLEAKLTVCRCSLIGNDERSKCVQNSLLMDKPGGRTLTVVFNSTICCGVELEAGNLVRIHPPWRNVQTMGDEKILLSTCFTQIQTLD